MAKELHDKARDTIRFIHITDTHLLNHSKETFYHLNTKKTLEAVLLDSWIRYPEIDFYLFTGDISQTGSIESYLLFRSVMQSYSFPIYCVPGNHDTPKLLHQIFIDSPKNSINIIDMGRFSLILLNSWVENKHHGIVSQRCLNQLDEHLKNSVNQFNIIAIHHPPVLINSEWLDALSLQNYPELLQVIENHSHQILLMCGHVHQEIDQQIDNLRLLATPSTCHQYKVNANYMSLVEMPLPAYRYIRIGVKNNIYTKVYYVEAPIL